MIEVFTIGGGEYVVNVMNAVAAWTGDGGYISLIQVVMVMGLIMSTTIVAFDANWRAWINWFLGATLMYLVLMVPRVDIQVTDRINPALAPSAVANVPLGLGLVAGFTSQISDYLTTGAELVFGLPNDLNYSQNGIIYGARLLEATQNVRINDPEFAANLDEHFRLCVFYDILLGQKSIDALSRSDDLLAAMGPGSVARSQKWLTRDPGGTVTAEIITCRIAYDRFVANWDTMQTPLETTLGIQLYPRLLGAAARTKLLADLPIAYDYLTNVSRTASQTLRQHLVINAMTQSLHTMQSGGSPSSVDVYAQTRAEIQTRNTYNSIGATAMKWVPLLNIVLTVVFYALFPIAFPIFLLPRGGVSALKGYVTGFFYLAAWGPLYVILHMILMLKAGADVAAVGAAGDGGVTLASYVGIAGVTDDIGILAGYLIASVPFLAAGIAKGALAISSQATSYLAPSQSASEEAAREASTGNIAVGNSSFDTQAFNMKQGNLWTTAGSYTSGVSSFTSVQGDGTRSTQYPESAVVDATGAMSRLPITPQLSQELQSSFTRSASETRSRAETLSNSASSSFSSANTQAADFRRTLSAGNGLETSFGADDRNTIGTTYSMVDQAATALQNRFGFERSLAESYANQAMFSGNFSTGLGWPGNQGAGGAGSGSGGSAGPGSGRVGVGVTTSGSKTSTTTGTASGTNGLSEAKDFLEQQAKSQNWGQQRDSFYRATANSSSSELAARSASLSASYSRANSVAQEARTAYETANRLEDAASLRDSNGVSLSENLTQPFVNFVLGEQRAMPGITPDWNPTRGQAITPAEIAERDFYIGEFIKAEEAKIRAGVEPSFVEPSPAGIARPSANTQAQVARLGAGGIAQVESTPVPIDAGLRTRDQIDDLRGDRGELVGAGGRYVGGALERREEAFERVRPTITPNPQETLNNVVGKDDRGITETTIDGIREAFGPQSPKRD
jgi:conjugal transfer mating pair stabilization protein TraG